MRDNYIEAVKAMSDEQLNEELSQYNALALRAGNKTLGSRMRVIFYRKRMAVIDAEKRMRKNEQASS